MGSVGRDFEIAGEVSGNGDAEVALAVADEIDQLAENGIVGKNIGVAHDDQVFLCARKGNVELAVDDAAIHVGEDVIGQEFELIALLHC